MFRTCLRLWPAVIPYVLLGGPAAQAQSPPRDSQIIVRALSFLATPPTGVAMLGIVFLPESASSLQAANRLADGFRDGVTAGALTLQPELVSANDLPELHDVAAIFIAGDAGAHAPALSGAARRLHVPIISPDLGCVRRGFCAIGYSIGATVHIAVSRAACADAGIDFIPAFRILVQEQ
jgi:hypothetical protein